MHLKLIIYKSLFAHRLFFFLPCAEKRVHWITIYFIIAWILSVIKYGRYSLHKNVHALVNQQFWLLCPAYVIVCFWFIFWETKKDILMWHLSSHRHCAETSSLPSVSLFQWKCTFIEKKQSRASAFCGSM